jgi:hypothetical protein
MWLLYGEQILRYIMRVSEWNGLLDPATVYALLICTCVYIVMYTYERVIFTTLGDVIIFCFMHSICCKIIS